MCRVELLEPFLPDSLRHAVRGVHACHPELLDIPAVPRLVVEEDLWNKGIVMGGYEC